MNSSDNKKWQKILVAACCVIIILGLGSLFWSPAHMVANMYFVPVGEWSGFSFGTCGNDDIPMTYTVSTTSDDDVAENFTRVALVKINQSGSYTPSREFLEYMNAPALTRQQKESALRIALTSKKFQGYMNESHGPISFGWAYPYSGMVRLSMTAGSATSRVYGLASVYIDIDREVLGNESFIDWKKYW